LILSIIIILFFAGFVYTTYSKSKFDVNTANYYRYNNYDFYRENNYWIAQIQVQKQPFNVRLPYSPVEVYDVPVHYGEDHLFTSYTAKLKPVYITFNPVGENKSYIAISSANIAFALSKVYGLNVTGACMINDSACANSPIINCSKDVDGLVIVMNDKGNASLVYNRNCLFVNGANQELNKASSRAVLEWYQILTIDPKTQEIIRPNITVFK